MLKCAFDGALTPMMQFLVEHEGLSKDEAASCASSRAKPRTIKAVVDRTHRDRRRFGNGSACCLLERRGPSRL